MRISTARVRPFLALLSLSLVLSLLACSTMEEKRDKFMDQGKASFEKGDYLTARLHFKNALQVDSNYAEGYLWLGKAELRLQNPRGTFGALSKAVELKPDLPEAQILLGNLFLMAKQVNEAEIRANQVLDKAPGNTDALMLLAAVAAARQQPDQALEILAKVRKLDARKVEAYLLAAAIQSQQKKTEAVAAILDEGLKANPQALPLFLTRARLAEEQKNYELAGTLLNQAQVLAPKDVRVQDELARLYLLQKQWDKAEEALRRKTALEPDKEAHAAALARYLAERGRATEGEKVLQDFSAAHPENLQAKFALANFYLGQRRFGKGGRLLRDIAAAEPTGPNGLKAKGELAVLCLGQGRQEEAEKLVREVLQANPKDMIALKLEGLLALTKKDGLKAVTNFRILTQDQPQNPENWLLLARAHQMHKEETLAKNAAKKAIDLKADYPEAKDFLYGLYLQKKDYDSLIKLIKDYLRANDRDLVNWSYLGDVYVVKGDTREAQAAFQKMMDLEPKNPRGYLKMALLSRKNKQPDAAAKYLEAALQQNPDFHPAVGLLAALYQEQQQPAKALEAVRAAVARAPNNAEMHLILGGVLLAQKQPEVATAALEKALTLNPGNTQALGLLIAAYGLLPDKAKTHQKLEEKAQDPQAPIFYALALAQLYELQKEGDKAIALYERLLERRAAPVIVGNNLAYLLAEHRPTPENLARAQKLAQEVLDDNPEDPRLLDTMGWIACRRGDYAQARQHLERAVAKAPDHPVLQYHFGFCLAQLGEKDAARQALEKALAAKGAFPERDAAQKLLDSLKTPGK